MSKNDGGPAFPFEYHNQTSRYQDSFDQERKQIAPGGAEQYGGMTLRDYFAAAAMSAMVGGFTYHTSGKAKGVAEEAYQMADAMIKEREKC